jgi:hypothetical protein
MVAVHTIIKGTGAWMHGTKVVVTSIMKAAVTAELANTLLVNCITWRKIQPSSNDIQGLAIAALQVCSVTACFAAAAAAAACPSLVPLQMECVPQHQLGCS